MGHGFNSYVTNYHGMYATHVGNSIINLPFEMVHTTPFMVILGMIYWVYHMILITTVGQWNYLFLVSNRVIYNQTKPIVYTSTDRNPFTN